MSDWRISSFWKIKNIMVTFVAKWSSSLDPTYMYMTFGVVRARQTVGSISGLDTFALE